MSIPGYLAENNSSSPLPIIQKSRKVYGGDQKWSPTISLEILNEIKPTVKIFVPRLLCFGHMSVSFATLKLSFGLYCETYFHAKGDTGSPTYNASLRTHRRNFSFQFMSALVCPYLLMSLNNVANDMLTAGEFQPNLQSSYSKSI